MSETDYSPNFIDPYKTIIVTTTTKKFPKRSCSRHPFVIEELFSLDLFRQKGINVAITMENHKDMS